jgi:hypothetical protein
MPNRVRRLGVRQALQRDVALTTTKAGEGARFSLEGNWRCTSKADQFTVSSGGFGTSAHHHGEI